MEGLFLKSSLLHIDILHDILIQRNRCFSDLQDMGRIPLMHPDDASWNDTKVAETVKPLMGFGRDENDSTFLPQSQFFKGDDEGFHLLLELGTAYPPWNGLAVDAGWRMAEKSANALRDPWAQDVFELASLLFHLFFGHLKNF